MVKNALERRYFSIKLPKFPEGNTTPLMVWATGPLLNLTPQTPTLKSLACLWRCRVSCVEEFGANSDSETALYHYLDVPFVARYVRFHPTHWKRRISMRVGLVGCPQTGLLLLSPSTLSST